MNKTIPEQVDEIFRLIFNNNSGSINSLNLFPDEIQIQRLLNHRNGHLILTLKNLFKENSIAPIVLLRKRYIETCLQYKNHQISVEDYRDTIADFFQPHRWPKKERYPVYLTFGDACMKRDLMNKYDWSWPLFKQEATHDCSALLLLSNEILLVSGKITQVQPLHLQCAESSTENVLDLIQSSSSSSSSSSILQLYDIRKHSGYESGTLTYSLPKKTDCVFLILLLHLMERHYTENVIENLNRICLSSSSSSSSSLSSTLITKSLDFRLKFCLLLCFEPNIMLRKSTEDIDFLQFLVKNFPILYKTILGLEFTMNTIHSRLESSVNTIELSNAFSELSKAYEIEAERYDDDDDDNDKTSKLWIFRKILEIKDIHTFIKNLKKEHCNFLDAWMLENFLTDISSEKMRNKYGSTWNSVTLVQFDDSTCLCDLSWSLSLTANMLAEPEIQIGLPFVSEGRCFLAVRGPGALEMITINGLCGVLRTNARRLHNNCYSFYSLIGLLLSCGWKIMNLEKSNYIWRKLLNSAMFWLLNKLQSNDDDDDNDDYHKNDKFILPAKENSREFMTYILIWDVLICILKSVSFNNNTKHKILNLLKALIHPYYTFMFGENGTKILQQKMKSIPRGAGLDFLKETVEKCSNNGEPFFTIPQSYTYEEFVELRFQLWYLITKQFENEKKKRSSLKFIVTLLNDTKSIMVPQHIVDLNNKRATDDDNVLLDLTYNSVNMFMEYDENANLQSLQKYFEKIILSDKMKRNDAEIVFQFLKSLENQKGEEITTTTIPIIMKQPILCHSSSSSSSSLTYEFMEYLPLACYPLTNPAYPNHRKCPHCHRINSEESIHRNCPLSEVLPIAGSNLSNLLCMMRFGCPWNTSLFKIGKFLPILKKCHEKANKLFDTSSSSSSLATTTTITTTEISTNDNLIDFQSMLTVPPSSSSLLNENEMEIDEQQLSSKNEFMDWVTEMKMNL